MARYTSDDHVHHTVAVYSGKDTIWRVGDSVAVAYNPSAPGESRSLADDDWANQIFVGVLTALIGVPIAIGVGVRIWGRPDRRSE